MLNRSASLAMSTSVLKALPGKLDIKRHSPSILYLPTFEMRTLQPGHHPVIESVEPLQNRPFGRERHISYPNSGGNRVPCCYTVGR